MADRSRCRRPPAPGRLASGARWLSWWPSARGAAVGGGSRPARPRRAWPEPGRWNRNSGRAVGGSSRPGRRLLLYSMRPRRPNAVGARWYTDARRRPAGRRARASLPEARVGVLWIRDTPVRRLGGRLRPGNFTECCSEHVVSLVSMATRCSVCKPTSPTMFSKYQQVGPDARNPVPGPSGSLAAELTRQKISGWAVC